MTLREELALRVSKISDSIMRRPGPTTAREAHNAFTLAVADEVIRQMEWARRGPHFAATDEDEPYPDLTLAPEDWSP